MEKRGKQGPKLGEAFFLALPFLAWLLAYGLVTGTVKFNQWPPNVEMHMSFGFPVIFSALIYFLLLLNLYARRKGTWKWYQDGLVSILAIVIFWYIISPIYKESVGRTERHKVGIHY